ncbi:hypothetical protein [Actinoplanes rectilineatus]|uniref:hypothetical protein n=1 Tax=Actinoplanes rectilineatus TaxID=113571 RepID=UPI0005F2D56A|nr:hypothetical protein [Actinoplanes rectilineatus]
MSRIAEIIVLAVDGHDVMEPLTRPNDGSRPWNAVFGHIPTTHGWVAEFTQLRHWAGLLEHLETLPWPRPESLQVLIHDEEDDLFGLWMIVGGKLTEIPLPGTSRHSYTSALGNGEEISILERTSGQQQEISILERPGGQQMDA